MFESYLVQDILKYLVLCKNCNKYCIFNYWTTCCICNIFYCSDCNNTNLTLNYNNYETLSNYCIPCNKMLFP